MTAIRIHLSQTQAAIRTYLSLARAATHTRCLGIGPQLTNTRHSGGLGGRGRDHSSSGPNLVTYHQGQSGNRESSRWAGPCVLLGTKPSITIKPTLSANFCFLTTHCHDSPHCRTQFNSNIKYSGVRKSQQYIQMQTVAHQDISQVADTQSATALT